MIKSVALCGKELSGYHRYVMQFSFLFMFRRLACRLETRLLV
jgi:hypothetical protein